MISWKINRNQGIWINTNLKVWGKLKKIESLIFCHSLHLVRRSSLQFTENILQTTWKINKRSWEISLIERNFPRNRTLILRRDRLGSSIFQRWRRPTSQADLMKIWHQSIPMSSIWAIMSKGTNSKLCLKEITSPSLPVTWVKETQLHTSLVSHRSLS